VYGPRWQEDRPLNWTTPPDLIDQLDQEFHFHLDANAHFDSQEAALLRDWKGTVFCSPPHDHGIAKWIQKASRETERRVTTVMLLPASTDARWFHDFCLRDDVEIRFLKGRLSFSNYGRAPSGSMIIIFRPTWWAQVGFLKATHFIRKCFWEIQTLRSIRCAYR
jgi:site-specific DNA-methyltransferase (adenine-specific)